MITGQDLADTLDGFEPIASMNPPPGAAYQAAMSALPAPRASTSATATPQLSSSFRTGLGF